MRSKLFVPGSRPELFQKALNSAADALSFDLEDSVTEDRKVDARESLRKLLCSDLSQTQKTLIVRVNALDTPHCQADIQAVVHSNLDYINLPKPETIADVLAAVTLIEKAEKDNQVNKTIKLLLNIESPTAFLNAELLAKAHPRVAGLQLGLGDLFEPLSIERRELAAIQQAMFYIRMAAGSAGIFAYDSAFANIKDEQGFLEEAKLAYAMGFMGKSCIHPSQIVMANTVFRPSNTEIAHAVNVVIADKNPANKGVGAYIVDGKMIDPPFVKSAYLLIKQAQELDLLSESQKQLLSITY